MKFNHFEELLSQTPNENTLILSTFGRDMNIFDAYHWQQFISPSLPHLRIFKFGTKIKKRLHGQLITFFKSMINQLSFILFLTCYMIIHKPKNIQFR
jgi:hypothetical protein